MAALPVHVRLVQAVGITTSAAIVGKLLPNFPPDPQLLTFSQAATSPSLSSASRPFSSRRQQSFPANGKPYTSVAGLPPSQWPSYPPDLIRI